MGESDQHQSGNNNRHADRALEKPRETYNSRKFQQRYAVHVADGLKGAEIFRALARDEYLPAFFTIKDVSAIVNISREGLRSRRSRRQPPDWTKPSKNQILYPREAVCEWLADACVKAKPNN
jgi:hypothetical protein